MLQQKLMSVEEELIEVRATVEEGRGREGEWIKSREHLQVDLEAAERRVEAAYQELEKEKESRLDVGIKERDKLSLCKNMSLVLIPEPAWSSSSLMSCPV